jgi:hypothetical protein
MGQTPPLDSTISGCLGQVYESGGSFSAAGEAGFAVCGAAAGLTAIANAKSRAAGLIGS